MNQAAERAQNRNDVVSEALAAARKADEMRGAAIKELLAQRDQINEDLKTLGYRELPIGKVIVNGAVSHDNAVNYAPSASRGSAATAAKRFKNLRLAQVARILLSETELLHGSMIEKLAHDGGFRGGTENFQNYLPVALKRAGGFENIGGNRWRLNENVTPQRG